MSNFKTISKPTKQSNKLKLWTVTITFNNSLNVLKRHVKAIGPCQAEAIMRAAYRNVRTIAVSNKPIETS